MIDGIMPVYANFFYVSRKKSFLATREQILAWVDFLIERDMITFDPGSKMASRRKPDGLFTRIKKSILGEMPPKEGAAPPPPPEPAVYLDPSRKERILVASREDVAARPEPADARLPYLRVELPYLTVSFDKEKIRRRADFERGWTLTRSLDPFPLLDEYKDIQCSCRKCREAFDPRQHLVSPSRARCPGCDEEIPIANLKMTPVLPLHQTVIGLEHTKVVDPEEDDPEKNGLDLAEYTEDFEKIFGVPFRYEVVYT
jgi:hypothetical protein